eukprot:GHUV01031980.1.p1 GENE.GHUV01031980.1~~GHUV01031980.1.p1  ORF type:complete len:104 (+),score=17.14 GHUV01031980.1:129-440(+)
MFNMSRSVLKTWDDHVCKWTEPIKSGSVRPSAAHVLRAGCLLPAGTDQRFKRLKVDGLHVGVSVWDTAGQDRFQSLTPMYFRGAHGVVFGELCGPCYCMHKQQ